MAITNGTNHTIQRVLILGNNFPATSIIRSLADAKIEVHVVHPRAPTSPDDRVIYHEHEIDSSLKPVLSEVKPDLIISTVWGGQYDTQKEIIDCAIEAGISRFMPSEFGQDSLNVEIQQRIPPSREKARTVEYLQQKAANGSLSWVAVATGVDLDRGLLGGNLGFDIKWQSATLHGKGHERFAGSSFAWIGIVVKAIIEHWQDVENQYLYAASLTTNADEIVKYLEEFTDRSFAVGRGDVDECVREAEKRIEQGYPDAGMFLMGRSIMYDEAIGGVRPFEEDDAKAKLGLEGERIDQVIKSVVHEHEHHGGKGDCGCG